MADDGPGLPPTFSLRSITSLGMRLVATLVEQIRGSIDVNRGPGARICVTIPVRSTAD